MTNPAHFTDRKWAAQEARRQAREVIGLRKSFWAARGATLVQDGQDVAYIMRLRRAMTLEEAKALCGQIADALNAMPTDGAAPDPDKGQAPQ